jgi:hypothetical protein
MALFERSVFCGHSNETLVLKLSTNSLYENIGSTLHWPELTCSFLSKPLHPWLELKHQLGLVPHEEHLLLHPRTAFRAKLEIKVPQYLRHDRSHLRVSQTVLTCQRQGMVL